MKRLLVLIIPMVFFIVAFLTLPHYGINWDEPLHFNRGQAYLTYFLTGSKNYLNIPSYPKLKGSSDFMGKEGEDKLFLESKTSTIPSDDSYRRSYFLSDVFNFEYFIQNDGYGHPPTNDILAALFNFVFYHKLNLLPDIESYHLFEITVSTLLIVGVAVFVYIEFGLIASVFASFSLATYPLFFAESHFNIKDPVQASFFGLSIIFFYFAIKKNKNKFLVFSSIFAGLALGTKFNIIFMPFIILPWFLFYFRQNFKKMMLRKSMWFFLVLFPFLMLIVFYAFWPYLWSNPFKNILNVIRFYKDTGTTSAGELDSFIRGGINFFAPYWISITTPLPILMLSILGIFTSIYKLIRHKKSVYLLLLIWLFVPIVRVMLPGTAIYTGVRHIMEFVPALAILAGIGTKTLFEFARNKFYRIGILVLLVTSCCLVMWEVARLHPNENVYFNSLIGGLPGARAANIPYWGYSYGNVYLQGVEWLNEHAEPSAKLGLPVVNMVNVPRIKLRPDIDFSNFYPSGPKQNGEYVMEMTYNWNLEKIYSYSYYDKFLKPVYQVKVDGVSLLTIWKNDKKHVKEEYKGLVEKEFRINNANIKDGILTVDVGKDINLTRIEIKHDDINCSNQKGGFIMLSSDKKNWVQEPEGIDYPQIPELWLGDNRNKFVFLFVGKKARYVYLDTQMKDSCILKGSMVRIFGW